MPYVGYRAASVASDLGYRRVAIGTSRQLANYRGDPIVLVRILFFFSPVANFLVSAPRSPL